MADYVFYHFQIAAGKTVYTTYVDSDPPILDISAPESTVTVNYVTIEGTVRGAAEVTVSGIDAPIASDGSFAVVVPLKLGENHIAVVATDLAGNKTERVITVWSLYKDFLSDLRLSAGTFATPFDPHLTRPHTITRYLLPTMLRV